MRHWLTVYKKIELKPKSYDSTEEWLNTIEDKLTYSRWYCGHYHTNKIIDKMKFLFKDFLELR